MSTLRCEWICPVSYFSAAILLPRAIFRGRLGGRLLRRGFLGEPLPVGVVASSTIEPPPRTLPASSKHCTGFFADSAQQVGAAAQSRTSAVEPALTRCALCVPTQIRPKSNVTAVRTTAFGSIQLQGLDLGAAERNPALREVPTPCRRRFRRCQAPPSCPSPAMRARGLRSGVAVSRCPGAITSDDVGPARGWRPAVC
jgi:hypothetical protein